MKSKVIFLYFFISFQFILFFSKNICAQYPPIYLNPLSYSYIGYNLNNNYFYNPWALANLYSLKANLGLLEMFSPNLSKYVYKYNYFLPNTFLLPYHDIFLNYMSDINQAWISTLPREWIDAVEVIDPQTGAILIQAPKTPWGLGVPGVGYLGGFVNGQIN